MEAPLPTEAAPEHSYVQLPPSPLLFSSFSWNCDVCLLLFDLFVFTLEDALFVAQRWYDGEKGIR